MELTLVGWQHDHAYVSEMRDAISTLPRPASVAIRDPVSFEAMPALFASQQILVVPSLVDPLPRVAAEAMAAGLVCIVSDRTGISALLADRKEAMIFPAGDAGALAESLRTAMRDPALTQALQGAGRKKAIEFFSTRRMVDEMEAFLVSSVERATARDQHPPLHEPVPAGPLGASDHRRHSATRDAST
jgi:glycosyltransferase involved in cell wall biosynthesis